MARAEKGNSAEKETALAVYTVKLDGAGMARLKTAAQERGYDPYEVDYAQFAFKSKPAKVNLVGYTSGKVVIQGKGTEDFVRDVLEPEVTLEARLGYDEVHHPEWFENHAGLDEAGKGDLFGPVVSACVAATPEAARALLQLGVADSKRLNDTTIARLEKEIKAVRGVAIGTAFCGMARYNELMAKPQANLNKLLAWLHARALRKVLDVARPDWGMVDQFSKKPLVQEQLEKDGVEFDLRMQTKAESDPVVAAASICARAEFVRKIKALGESVGRELPKGAGAPAKRVAEELVAERGAQALDEIAKLHFRTAKEVLGLPVPPKKAWRRG